MTEGKQTPGHIRLLDRVKSRYSLEKLVVEAPPSSVVPLSQPLEKLYAVILTTSVSGLMTALQSSSGSYVPVKGAEVLGTLKVNLDGSFSGAFKRPSVNGELLIVSIGTQSNPAIFLPEEKQLNVTIAQFISWEDGENGFTSVSSTVGPRTKQSLSPRSVVQEVHGVNWISEENILEATEGMAAAVTLSSHFPYSNKLNVTGFFSGSNQIPSASLVSGIRVHCYWSAGGSNANPKFRLIKGGKVVGEERGMGYQIPYSRRLSPEFGGAGDNWGVELYGSDVNSENFGIQLTIHDISLTASPLYAVEVDYCTLSVFYTVSE